MTAYRQKAVGLAGAGFWLTLVVANTSPPPGGGQAPDPLSVTFSENIAPILYDQCITCHRPGEVAPFPLISYEDVSARGALIAAATAARHMPPWHARSGGEFVGDRRLRDEQIRLIASWVEQGMPPGDPARMPALPQFTDGWALGDPDLVLEMPVAFELPAAGRDVFRNFVLPTGLTDDVWVRAVELRPRARAAAHHALFAYTPAGTFSARDGADGQPGFGGSMAVGFVPGQGDWQEFYAYKEPIALARGTRLAATIIYDNSADNPRNSHHPSQRVRWGLESSDEMGTVGLLLEVVNADEEPALRQALADRTRAAIQRGVADGTVQRYLAQQAVAGAAGR